MDQDLVEYILRNYFNFINKEEHKLYNQLLDYHNWLHLEKYSGMEVAKDKLDLYDLTMDDVTRLSSVDRSKVDCDVATRIWNTHKEELFLNTCPLCGRLARIKDSRQCRNGHRW